MSLEIVVQKGPAQGLVMPLRGRRSVTIGRAPNNALVLRDEKVSSHHARLDIAPGGVVLTDLGSKNGTYAAGESVVGSRLITPGIEIAMGGSAVLLRRNPIISDLVGNGQPMRPSAVHGGNGRGGGTTAVAERSRSRLPSVKDLDCTQRDLVLEPAQRGQRNLTKAQRNLAVLIDVGALISSERDQDKFLARLMDLIFEVLPADRGVLMLREGSGAPTARVTRASKRAGDEAVLVPKTILNKVMGDGVSILTADAGADVRLSSGASIIAQRVRSAMCVPIRGKRQVLGGIYVDTVLSIGVFGEDDLHVLSTVGLLAGTAIENIQLIEENLQQERMAAIGKVIAGLGHDIRNMLTALKGGMYLIDESLREGDDEEMESAWGIVKNGHESITSLVQDMVNYSKPREPEWRRAHLARVTDSAMAFATERAKDARVHVESDLDSTIQEFWFDPKGIERCVLNLVSNAIDACAPETGRVTLRVHKTDDGKFGEIVVADNGEGIPPENRQKVFDLLFSTKGKRGTGFGLAITKKIVEEHGGTITLVSEVGRGTTFTISIPLWADLPRDASGVDGDPH